MKCVPSRPVPDPVNAEMLVSPNDAALPSIPSSSPGAATQRTTPPKALNERLARYRVEDRWPCVVVTAQYVIGGLVSAAVAGSSTAVALPLVPAVTVPAAKVESRARTIQFAAE